MPASFRKVASLATHRATVSSLSLLAVRGKRTRTILAFLFCSSTNHSDWSSSLTWTVGESRSIESTGEGGLLPRTTRVAWDEVEGDTVDDQGKRINCNVRQQKTMIDPTSLLKMTAVDMVFVEVAVIKLRSPLVFPGIDIPSTSDYGVVAMNMNRVVFRFRLWSNSYELRLCNIGRPAIGKHRLIGGVESTAVRGVLSIIGPVNNWIICLSVLSHLYWLNPIGTQRLPQIEFFARAAIGQQINGFVV